MKELKTAAESDEDDFSDKCDSFGVFTNFHTLEVDLFNNHDFTEHIIETLREHKFGAERKGWIDEWGADPNSLDVGKYLALIETVGKGRFAQRLASRIKDIVPPDYIRRAIEFVVSRV
jgi:putative ATP-dependent endonuclease of OLD family